MGYTKEERKEMIKEMHQKLFMEDDCEGYVDIYYKVVPLYLYQYRRGKYLEEKSGDLHIYDIENLYKNQVWASSASNFNDPFDCRILIDAKELKNKKKEAIFNTYLKKAREERARYTYVSCFSEYKDSLCMWSYYADNHKGFCVEYETESLKEVVVPVNYTNESLPASKINDSDNRILLGTVTKAPDWQHESEWRMVLCQEPDTSPKEGVFFKSCKPNKILLGCKSESYLEKALTEFCKKQKVDLYKMEMNTDKYQLIPMKVLEF